MVLEEFLEEARARGAALLLASHVPNDLLAFSEHVFVLAGGRILHEGRSQALLKGVHGGRSMAELFQTKAAASTPPPGSGSTP